MTFPAPFDRCNRPKSARVAIMQESRGEAPGGRGGGWVQHSQLLLERTFQKAALMLAAAFFDLWLMQNTWTVEAAFDTEYINSRTYIARRREGGSVEWWRQHCSRVPVAGHYYNNCCTVPK